MGDCELSQTCSLGMQRGTMPATPGGARCAQTFHEP